MNPYPYQIEGARFLAERTAALLADEMGLGKTVQAILAADEVGARKIGVVCPAIARPVWRREFARWQKADRPIDVHAPGVKSERRGGVEVFSFEYAAKHRPTGFDTLIIDESHNLGNPTAGRTRAVLGDAPNGVVGMCSFADHTWCLSGTPMRRDPSSVYPVVRSLAPELLDDMTPKEYGRRYLEWNRYGPRPVIVGGKNLDELRERIRPFFLRRRADDVLDLPPIHFSAVPIGDNAKVDDVAIEAAKRVSQNDMAKIRNEISADKALRCAGMVASELDLGLYEKIVVFAWHRDALDTLETRLKSYGTVRIDGSTSDTQREHRGQQFQTDPNCRVLIGQIQAAGVAITATAANQILFCELDWEPLNNAQAALRTRRIGQTKPSFVRMAYTDHWMDHAVTAAAVRKSQEKATLWGAGIELDQHVVFSEKNSKEISYETLFGD